MLGLFVPPRTYELADVLNCIERQAALDMRPDRADIRSDCAATRLENQERMNVLSEREEALEKWYAATHAG